jgi:DNA repair protein RecN (Recombination protein N)
MTQVLCVTHLPQVAAQGSNTCGSKSAGKRQDLASELTLGPRTRVEEVARMLGGVKMTENTLAHAREMLALAS